MRPHSLSRLGVRVARFSYSYSRFTIGLLWTLPLYPVLAAQLTIVSWGGVYEASQRRAFFDPFSAETGVEIVVESYNGGIGELQAQYPNPRWDVVDLTMSDNQQACRLGLLTPIEPSVLAPAPDGTPAIDDFLPNALQTCAVSLNVYSTLIAFDTRAFPIERPQTISALFDIERFPGKRALQNAPMAILEWALRDYGVPRADLYDLLSTERGLDLAFARLDRIKNDIIWWQDGAEPARLLEQGQVVIASGYNGRFFDAAIDRNASVQTLWDNQLVEYSTWGIVQSSPRVELALQFVRYATQTAPLAAQTQYISYGPARHSSMALVGRHTASGLDMRPYLPTFPANYHHAIVKDYDWYANTQPKLQQRFEHWRDHRN